MVEFSKGDEVVIKPDAVNYLTIYLFYKDMYLKYIDKSFDKKVAEVNKNIKYLNGVVSHKLESAFTNTSYCINFNYNGMEFYTPVESNFLEISKKQIREDKINKLLDK